MLFEISLILSFIITVVSIFTSANTFITLLACLFLTPIGGLLYMAVAILNNWERSHKNG